MKNWSLLILSCAVLSLSLLGCTRRESKISGTIDILPELQARLSPQAVLFIVARPVDQPSGPPALVKRFTQPFSFPIQFELTQQDAMIPDSGFSGKYTITARIAQTGSATPLSKGDLEGKAHLQSIPVGSKNLQILLNTVSDPNSKAPSLFQHP